MKKHLSLILILAMVLSLTACGKSEDSSDNKSKDNSTSESSNEELEKALAEKEEYDPMDYVQLGDYKGIKVATGANDEDIQSKIDQAISDNSFERITDRAAKDGDTVNINFVGTMDGKEFDGGSYEGADLELGSNSFIDGFEQGIVGMKVGEEKSLNLKFPDPYPNNPDYSGKDVVFAVTLNFIKGEATTPEFNDEFVSTITNGEYKTVDAYKEKISADILKENQDNMGNTAFSTVLDSCKVSDGYPEFLNKLMFLQLQATQKAMAEQAQYTDYAKYLSERYGCTEDQMNEELQKTAKLYVQQKLITEAIAQKENLQVTDEEYKQELNSALMNYNMKDENELRTYVTKTYASTLEDLLNMSILTNKVMEFVKTNAVEVNEPSPTSVPADNSNGAGDAAGGAADTDTGTESN